MIELHPQFVVDEKQERTAVLLTPKEWGEVLEALEEFEDIRAYDLAKSRAQDFVPFEEALREIESGDGV